MQKPLEKGKKYSAEKVASWCFNHCMFTLARLITDQTPEKPFISDGASCIPSVVAGVDVYPAALVHDIKYWSGLPGDEDARFLADLDLARDVVVECGGSADLAMEILSCVRVAGTEWGPTTCRWGFGRAKS